ncbi:MAG: hypothetical protein JXQ87_01195 [Bacteroidia bacterium]
MKKKLGLKIFAIWLFIWAISRFVGVFHFEHKHTGGFCEIQEGELAGTPKVFHFVFNDGSNQSFGAGSDTLFLVEDDDSGAKWALPLMFWFGEKHEWKFECFLTNEKLGKLYINTEHFGAGFSSRRRYIRFINDYTTNEILDKLKICCEFVDQRQYSPNSMSTSPWDGKLTLRPSIINGNYTGLGRRRLTIDLSKAVTKDSITFSTMGGYDSLLSHEIIVTDTIKKSVTFKRYNNYGHITFDKELFDTWEMVWNKPKGRSIRTI